MQQQKVLINSDRLKRTLEKFAEFGRTENNGVTRLSLSKEDVAARDYFVSCCEEIGMTVKIDDMANIYATMPGIEDKPPLVIGSHLDSVKKGGRFDGVLGVIAGLEVARTLYDHHIQPKIPLMIVNFTNEEGARFDPAMMCSGVISGKFEKAKMLESRDVEGITFGEALTASGYEGEIENRLTEATAFLEMHIEQGPVLESESLKIGIVEGVVGMVNYEIAVHGESDHAGTTPMWMRKDALFTATDIMTQLRTKLNALDHDLVYTMGRMNVHPNIHTVIPNQVVFTLEARHKDPAVINQVVQIIHEVPETLGGCSVSMEKLWGRDTVIFDKKLCDQLEKSARSLGYSNKRMYSGAGHDAQFISSYLPTAMLFVPSVNGKSHCEEELTSYEECANGVNVILDTVLAISEY
ncbi:Zn-dependent hydrolase [Heyndrickxia ginsengihumi]|uniref:Allantoate amidohydrolase n=1 Tax=Heyndrickxia ginsengihumi TaxID=363870 RepID=A0A0A6XZ61_9BACI|nr:Zn-dependent hydrolase [Heyndrickxia ginsengihumi]KHD85392.1 allantoate amidohydrolase [Heyndrickxia ginsengihumi]MCM3022594.1 Zn-dependent hydrolase [Heyndrickxia ginsengihumi]NEY19070.1 Zn-dependent hydrolase [Heyndrickxia ginsengihumi]